MSIDVIVIGGGVAAAAASRILAGTDLAWCVVAPDRVQRDVIGESLAPTAAPLLDELGLSEAFARLDASPSYSRFSVWGSDRVVEQSSMLQRASHSWTLDRMAFEDMLWCELEPQRFWTTVRHLRGSTGKRTLILDDGESLTTRFLLDCTGRRGLVVRNLATRSRLDKLVGVYAFLEHRDPEVEPTPGPMTESRPDGWWYSALLPGDRLVITYFTDTPLLPRDLTKDPQLWRRHLTQAPYTWRRIQSAGFDPSAMPATTDAGSLRAHVFGDEDWLAAGDAALAFDPLSSHGITSALWSGMRAAQAAIRVLRGDHQARQEYAQTLEKAWLAYNRQRTTAYAAETRFQDQPFWRERH